MSKIQSSETDYRSSHLQRGKTYDGHLADAPFGAHMNDLERLHLTSIVPRLFPAGIPKYLDFACGTARITQTVAPFAKEAVGVDISPTMLEQARRKCPDVQFIEADLTQGGLAIGTVVICVVMAAMTGVVGAAVTAMGILALPEMLRRGYRPQLALGTICASGTLGILIPPSVLTIVYAVTAQVSIGKMLIAGLLPGLLLATLYIGYIVVVGWLKPEWVPLDSSVSRTPLKRKLLALKALIFPALLIVLILGSIFFGIATPTESAAVGVAGAIIPALLKGRMNIGLLRQSGVDTLKATSMILWITLGAKAYVAIFTGLGGADTLLSIIRGMDVDRWVILAAMMLLLIFLGTVLDEIGIILLTVPVFLPIVRLLGFDEIWFGVLYAITIQMGYISPPFGYTLFYIKGTLPPHIGMGAVYQGILPFLALQFIGLLICAAFPGLVTFLPELMTAR